MAWARIHDGALSHAKLFSLVNLSHPFDLWVWGLMQSQMHLTDGLISREIVPRKALRAAAVLVDRRLWEAHPIGWKIHDYLAWNDCRDKVEQKRADQKRRREEYEARKRAGKGDVGTHSERVPNASPDASITTPPTPPTPQEHKEQGGGVPIFLNFPLEGEAVWPLTIAQVIEWESTYRGVSVPDECRKALAWLRANPGRRKTAKGMAKFLVGWLGRAGENTRSIQSRHEGSNGGGRCPHHPMCPSVTACVERTIADARRTA